MPQNIFCDGMSNKRVSGYCIYIPKQGKPPYVEYRAIRADLTNNEMEWKAVYRALVLSHTGDTIYTDSELVAKQISGEYRVKEARFKGFVSACRKIIEEKKISVKWCGRDSNLAGQYIEGKENQDR